MKSPLASSAISMISRKILSACSSRAYRSEKSSCSYRRKTRLIASWKSVHLQRSTVARIKRPDRFDLLHIEHAAPRRHLGPAVENRIDEAIMVGRTRTGE